MMTLQDFWNEMHAELTGRLIPFWHNLRDDAFGGYYGRMSFDLAIDPNAIKGGILCSRILWFFSAAYQTLHDQTLLDDAEHAYRFLKEHMIDHTYGGVYWSVTHDGLPADDSKHTYCQSFALYALSKYAECTNNQEALALAYDQFHLIEQKCFDGMGYLESFSRDFSPASNEKLSENGVMAYRTMNTLLHVFEAYSGLYKATRDARVGEAMRRILDIWFEHIYSPALRRQEVFFDADYHSLIDLHSYGHDIESSWLMEWGCSLLGDAALSARLAPAMDALAAHVYEKAFRDHSLLSECENGRDNRTRTWWAQAETVVGFMAAWQRTPERMQYLQASQDMWRYIQAYVIDPRPGSEWFSDINDQGKPANRKDIVEPWKCPYHNGRMCIEMIVRLDACKGSSHFSQ